MKIDKKTILKILLFGIGCLLIITITVFFFTNKSQDIPEMELLITHQISSYQELKEDSPVRILANINNNDTKAILLVIENSYLPKEIGSTNIIIAKEVIYFDKLPKEEDVSFPWCGDPYNSILYSCEYTGEISKNIYEVQLEVTLKSTKKSEYEDSQIYLVKIKEGLISFEDDSTTKHDFNVTSNQFEVLVEPTSLE